MPGSQRDTIQKILCLPYLPYTAISHVFNDLRSTSDPALFPLFDYSSRNWVNGNFWKPECWSVYQKAIRTNNDAEGLHNLWNQRTRAVKIKFYPLTEILFKIAEQVPLDAKLLSHGKMKREQRASSREKDRILFALWERFNDDQLTATQLLDHLVTELHPSPSTEDIDLEDSLPYDRYDMSLEEE